jgi:hypothetical protein
MVELVLFIVAVAIGAGIARILNHAGARGALPAFLQRSHDRHQRMEAARRGHAVVDRHRVRV